ncbi:MAG: hypothetical protein RLZZ561_947 [Pseudomonadota bacterium]
MTANMPWRAALPMVVRARSATIYGQRTEGEPPGRPPEVPPPRQPGELTPPPPEPGLPVPPDNPTRPDPLPESPQTSPPFEMPMPASPNPANDPGSPTDRDVRVVCAKSTGPIVPLFSQTCTRVLKDRPQQLPSRGKLLRLQRP